MLEFEDEVAGCGCNLMHQNHKPNTVPIAHIDGGMQDYVLGRGVSEETVLKNALFKDGNDNSRHLPNLQ